MCSLTFSLRDPGMLLSSHGSSPLCPCFCSASARKVESAGLRECIRLGSASPSKPRLWYPGPPEFPAKTPQSLLTDPIWIPFSNQLSQEWELLPVVIPLRPKRWPGGSCLQGLWVEHGRMGEENYKHVSKAFKGVGWSHTETGWCRLKSKDQGPTVPEPRVSGLEVQEVHEI